MPGLACYTTRLCDKWCIAYASVWRPKPAQAYPAMANLGALSVARRKRCAQTSTLLRKRLVRRCVIACETAA